ncbi:MAG: TolC family protein, partial [Caulobacteraceae bacterium]
GAAATVLASRQSLRQTESEVLGKVIGAYVDVRRDRETVRILRDQIDDLAGDFRETQARGALGVASKTDVAQAQARLLGARSQFALAQGRLNASSAEYLAVVGESPGELEPEPSLPGMPANADEAFAAAEENNPQLKGAIEAERAAREKVNQARAAIRPTVSLRVDAAIEPVEPYLPKPYDEGVTAAAVVTQPIFTSGLYSSKIRQAKEADNEAELDIEVTRRNVIQLVGQAWDQLAADRAANTVLAQQVGAEEAALNGARIEERAGLRTTLDLLNAEAELGSAQINLIQGRHDEYVAGATLLAAMGLLEARYLTPTVQLYDPADSLQRVRHRGIAPWVGLVSKIDGLGGPSTRLPALSAPGAGAERPLAPPVSSDPGP